MSSRRHTPAVDRFPFFVTITDTDRCIEWTGAKMKTGYGFMNEGGKPKVATHVALEYDNRPRPSPDLFALHSCDNPSCVNPKHLRWGTQTENMQDQIARGRNPRSLKTHCASGHALNEGNTEIRKNGGRNCKTCSALSKKRKRADGPGKGWAKGIPKAGAGERRVPNVEN